MRFGHLLLSNSLLLGSTATARTKRYAGWTARATTQRRGAVERTGRCAGGVGSLRTSCGVTVRRLAGSFLIHQRWRFPVQRAVVAMRIPSTEHLSGARNL